jgi:hypothetical protein
MRRLRGMSDLLAIVGPAEQDAELVDQIARRFPDRVTVLVPDGDPEWASEESDSACALRDRLAELLNAIETRTGAAVVGLAGDADQLVGWRFDRVVKAGELPVAA